MKIAARRDAILRAIMLQQRRDQLDASILATMVPIYDHMDEAINRVVESDTTDPARLAKLREEIRTWPDGEGKRQAVYRVRKLLESDRFNQEKTHD